MPKRTPLPCTPDNCGDLFPQCGTRSNYSSRGCRCDACFAKYSEYQKRHYTKHKDSILEKCREYRELNPGMNAERCRTYRENNLLEARQRDRQRYVNNREQRLAADRERYAANPEPFKKRAREYRITNLDLVKEKEKARRKKNRRVRAERNKRWAEANPEKVREARRRSRQKNAAKRRMDCHRRRAIKRQAFVENVDQIKVYEAANYICQMCAVDCRNAKWPALNSPSLDHIVPLSKGGKHEYANVQLLCYSCNARKRDRTELLPATVEIDAQAAE